MTPESNKMALKSFTEAYTSLLKAYGADELRCILTNMALDVDSVTRSSSFFLFPITERHANLTGI